jgi:hypothetical protein
MRRRSNVGADWGADRRDRVRVALQRAAGGHDRGLATGRAGGLNLADIVSAYGKAFAENRYMGLIWLTPPFVHQFHGNPAILGAFEC